MEPPTFAANKSKFHSDCDFSMDDPDVVEIMASNCKNPTSTSRKRKKSKVVPLDVIEIDEDDESTGVIIIDENVSPGNKGKDKLTGHSNNRKEVLAQEFTVSSSATELGFINDISLNPLLSSAMGSNSLRYLSGVSLTSPNYGFNYFPYSYNGALHYDGTTSSHAPFEVMELSLGLGAPFPGFEQPAEIFSKEVTSSIASNHNLLSSSYYEDKEDEFWLQKSAKSQKKEASTSCSFPGQPSHTTNSEEDKDEVLKKYRSFKRFDTVGDYSDHHYAYEGSKSNQPARNWAKAIQQEWKILENDLPDTIFVRVYEERMDLLRAVIVGAAGTPYHDGLFFFDFKFSSTYPSVPPKVHYHSGGLRLNPNLYDCGKVCLSLLNTWEGRKEEKWTPRKSTVLQVLLSIQALVLNAKPFFNEPGYASMAGGVTGEKMARDYNESTYILSCRTMLYTLNKPPKHFEEFVAGHFRDRAEAILVACKAYMDGAQVGCLVEGGVQDLDEGDKSCSANFKMQVGTIVGNLVPAFIKNGSKDCGKFLPQTNNNKSIAYTTMPTAYALQPAYPLPPAYALPTAYAFW
ncbi:hypothetical protein AQUCO_08400010v1 [Aquilegia coerulea]|uniref:E2 ubiquitin-conjugating enzyme n=1 Tax=Aquilegia coerulea TaxID=218851 RepID=A0A2G5C6N5_AQUCA|nr:hypothetical protein AQUCO_08400010v1 [Aquilegia coerulea]